MFQKSCVFFSNFAVKVYELQAYLNMEMTRKRISFDFDTRDLLSLQTGLSFASGAVACAILERIYSSKILSESTTQGN